MINEILIMNGYGLYVWSAFTFTLLSFTSIFVITKLQYIHEKKNLLQSLGILTLKEQLLLNHKSINREILSNTSNI